MPAPPRLTAQPLDPVAIRLGNAGLLPFVLGAILVWLFSSGNDYVKEHAFVMLALSAYAALIISFLGGIYWGLAFLQPDPARHHFVWGSVTPLLAWVALVMPAYAGLVLHGVMLVVCYLVDRRHYPALGAGAWLTMRFRLSAVASLSCFLAAASS